MLWLAVWLVSLLCVSVCELLGVLSARGRRDVNINLTNRAGRALPPVANGRSQLFRAFKIGVIHFLSADPRGRDQNFFLLGGRPKDRKSRGGLFGMGSKPPPHQLGGLGSAVSSPSGVQGGATSAQRLSTIFITQDGLS